MTEPLSPQSLIEIERRCSRATPGPWKSYVEGRDHSSGDSFTMTGEYVVVPFSELQVHDKQMLLPGATKQSLTSLPEFKYSY